MQLFTPPYLTGTFVWEVPQTLNPTIQVPLLGRP